MMTWLTVITIFAVAISFIAMAITFINWRDDRKKRYNTDDTWDRRNRAKKARQFQIACRFFLASFVWPVIILWAIWVAFVPTLNWIKKARYQFRADLEGAS